MTVKERETWESNVPVKPDSRTMTDNKGKIR